jgi:cytochrome c-type biogenesis protein CcmH/NrfF
MSARWLAVLTAVLALAAAAPAGAAEPKASLPDIEDEVMCVSCNVALNVAESPQAYRQRELIRDLIEQGLTKEQIKERLVQEYGEAVLALPGKGGGVGVAAYLVPIGVVAALAALVALLLPRWRRHGRGAAAAAGAAPHVTEAELRRLDEDLRRFD